MNAEELTEVTEHAQHSGQKAIGLTTAIVAVLLATVSLLSHRSHTEAILLQGKIVDEWSFYQAKHGRAHEYGALAAIAAVLPNGKDTAVDDLKKSVEEECGLPTEKNCTTPAKDLTVLHPLLGEMAEKSQGKRDESRTITGGKVEENAGAAKTPDHEKAKPAKEAAVKEGAVKIQEHARELEVEQHLAEKRADFYDSGELFLEISIVLCSIGLLAEAKLYWRMSFVTTAIGLGVAGYGWFLR